MQTKTSSQLVAMSETGAKVANEADFVHTSQDASRWIILLV